jgi:N-acetylmuramic acid 6-phosphate etherase
MVDVVPTNLKLIERQVMIVVDATGCTRTKALQVLKQNNQNCKQAIVMLTRKCSSKIAAELLEKYDGSTRLAIEHGVAK